VGDHDLLGAAFFVIEAAFYQRRKNIRNSMTAYFASKGRDAGLVEALLKAANISPLTRGEALTLDDFWRLGNSLFASK
jgi:16S rRNA (adenine1518-N6/adenine1519-N6)-dimethyltransferase